ncbi:hypothetical protein QR680_000182 [Steinernema hermaphroditum]|uniref:SGNH hydrolase-type esterase domain-containing protein n=1 Tax=Steinernema hermaphroditum TaxID=289476 RepID=A0AA39LDK6_9BILA|nr:hypothetical protein QR680_000182 [Steinernema hermaphroditum]
MTYAAFWLLVAIPLCGGVHKPHSMECSSLIVFGDGFTDDGAEVSDLSHGFMRNSNGPVWPEYLNKELECGQYENYAYSGAKSGLDNFYFGNWSGVLWQVKTFISRNVVLPPDVLVVLQTGGLIDMFSGEKSTEVILDSIAEAVDLLASEVSSGTLLLLNLPDVSSAPGISSIEQSDQLKETMLEMTSTINQKLRWMLIEKEGILLDRRSNLKMKLFDLNDNIVNSMKNLNTTRPFTYQSTDIKAHDVHRYGYFDLWHPTSRVHYDIARKIRIFLEDH